MASLLALRLRPRPLALLVCGLVPLAAAVGCGSPFVATDVDAGAGGALANSGGGAADGESSGGSSSEDDGQNASGGQMASDAPEFSGGAPSSGGTSGAGGAGGERAQTGPCYDEPCEGSCVGNCDDGFTCDDDGPPEICAQAFTTFCGCDGVSFTLPNSCPTMAYADDDACEVSDESHDCNPDHITCLPIVAPEPCPSGEVYSVESSCYGECVPVGQCACTSHADCPDPNGTDEYACHGTTDRCGPWL